MSNFNVVDYYNVAILAYMIAKNGIKTEDVTRPSIFNEINNITSIKMITMGFNECDKWMLESIKKREELLIDRYTFIAKVLISPLGVSGNKEDLKLAIDSIVEFADAVERACEDMPYMQWLRIFNNYKNLVKAMEFDKKYSVLAYELIDIIVRYGYELFDAEYKSHKPHLELSETNEISGLHIGVLVYTLIKKENSYLLNEIMNEILNKNIYQHNAIDISFFDDLQVYKAQNKGFDRFKCNLNYDLLSNFFIHNLLICENFFNGDSKDLYTENSPYQIKFDRLLSEVKNINKIIEYQESMNGLMLMKLAYTYKQEMFAISKHAKDSIADQLINIIFKNIDHLTADKEKSFITFI